MPWQPGESGNPDGAKRPKKFLAALERALKADDGAPLRRVVDRLVESAVAGEPWAVKEIADRLDGKPAQSLVADTEGGSVAIALVAYHPTQLQSEAVSVAGPRSIGLRDQESGSRLAS